MRSTSLQVAVLTTVGLVALALGVFRITHVDQPYALGAVCNVQLKRDLLDPSCEHLALPTTGMTNGNEIILSGRFVRLTRKHIVVNPSNGRGDWHFDKEIWIPLENVVMFSGDVPPRQ